MSVNVCLANTFPCAIDVSMYTRGPFFNEQLHAYVIKGTVAIDLFERNCHLEIRLLYAGPSILVKVIRYNARCTVIHVASSFSVLKFIRCTIWFCLHFPDLRYFLVCCEFYRHVMPADCVCVLEDKHEWAVSVWRLWMWFVTDLDIAFHLHTRFWSGTDNKLLVRSTHWVMVIRWLRLDNRIFVIRDSAEFWQSRKIENICAIQ